MKKPHLETMAVPLEMAKAIGDGRRIKGYASVFNYPIKTGDHFDTFVRPGAFARTIKEAGDQVVMLFNHGKDPEIGEKPLGKITELREDSRGLYFEGRIAETSYGKDIMELMRDGALDGVSIQFESTQEEWNEDRTERYIKQVKLYELGPVTYPANVAATAQLHKRQAEASSEDDSGAKVAASSSEDSSTWAKRAETHEAEQKALEARLAQLKEE